MASRAEGAAAAFNAAGGDALLEVEASPSVLSIGVSGSLGLDEAGRLQGLLKDAIDGLEPGQGLELDLSGVTYISSTGVGAIANAVIHSKRTGARLVVPAISPKAASVLKALGILDYLTMGSCRG